ncbi:MAG: phosphate transport system permease protein [Halieaceae bacterium]|jgi:phosphate transport system permease protein
MPAAEQQQGVPLGRSLQSGVHRTEPMVWLSAGAVVAALLLLLGLLLLLAGRGFTQFWPQPLVLLQSAEQVPVARLGVILDDEPVPTEVLLDSPAATLGRQSPARRMLLFLGEGGGFDSPLLWLSEEQLIARSEPLSALYVVRRAQGPIFGFLESVSDASGRSSARDISVQQQVQLMGGGLNRIAGMPAQGPEHRYQLRLASGHLVDLPLADVARVFAPNNMRFGEKIAHFFRSLGRFVSESPRRVNAQGGVFPAIAGTVMLVVLMSLIVAPLGVLAAVYLQEYAQRGLVTRLVRIAVNNLAGVPSIVYGVFGLGFFVYGLGGSIDALFFEDRLPAPTLGSPGLLWASLTMALLTLPVVIVTTEEGLARVPSSLREGSLALGATRAETLWRVVLPAASPAVLTGLILAVARATGEVAPLILVGVAKYAPGLPVSTQFPYLHLDRQFMHLGFHIYDLGFQSPHLETAEGLLFATALLLVLIVFLLNFSAVMLRSRLRDAFKP